MTVRYVTKTGRAIRTGRTTRASLSVRRPAVKPLPLHLQCHPPALYRTTHNPACEEFAQPTGHMRAVCRGSFMAALVGSGLSETPNRVRVVVEGYGTWYAADSAHAFAWAKAAQLLALTVKVYIDQ